MRKAIFVLSASIFIFSGFTNAFAQCGATGLDPCIVKIIKPAAKTVVKKADTVKKAVVPEVNKKSQAKSTQTKTKNNKNNKTGKSIYDSLMLEPAAKSASGDNELFPVNGVTLGRTTESQMQLLGGKRETFNDSSTGTQRVYYTINDMNFWLRDGVADSVGIYKFIDRMPARWMVYGFDFNLSYNESVKLLEGMDYAVQTSVSLPKLEEIGRKNTTARITATKDGAVPVMIVMSFLFDGGKKFDSPETLLYMFAGVKH